MRQKVVAVMEGTVGKGMGFRRGNLKTLRMKGVDSKRDGE